MDAIEKAAAEEFDRWARAGRAESMAEGHRNVTEQVLQGWSLGPSDRVLDIGCGNGWAVHWLVQHGAGTGVGVDVSSEMIHRARLLARDDARFDFRVSGAADLPFPDGWFSHLLSVESIYYYPRPGQALAEWRRVAAPGARLAVVIDLYAENAGSLPWVDALDVPVHVLGADELARLVHAAGWAEVQWRQVRDTRPVKSAEAFEPSRYWPSYELYRAYREAGALAVEAVAR